MVRGIIRVLIKLAYVAVRQTGERFGRNVFGEMIPLVVLIVHERALTVGGVIGQASAGHEQAIACIVEVIGVVAPWTETAHCAA